MHVARAISSGRDTVGKLPRAWAVTSNEAGCWTGKARLPVPPAHRQKSKLGNGGRLQRKSVSKPPWTTTLGPSRGALACSKLSSSTTATLHRQKNNTNSIYSHRPLTSTRLAARRPRRCALDEHSLAASRLNPANRAAPTIAGFRMTAKRSNPIPLYSLLGRQKLAVDARNIRPSH